MRHAEQLRIIQLINAMRNNFEEPPFAPLAQTLPGAAYTDPDLFRFERTKIFSRSWLCAGRSDALETPGEFVTVDAGDESVVIIRGRDGVLRAFCNLCRHRGARLCMDSGGRLEGRLRCMYHGWTYDLDGRLVAAPNLAGLGAGVKDTFSLHPVAIEEWIGYIWVNAAEHCGPAVAQLEPQLLARMGTLDGFLRYGICDLGVGRTIVYDVAANWKSLVENFTECYHCSTLHPELTAALPEFGSGYGTISGGIGRGASLAEQLEAFSLSGVARRKPLPGLTPSDDRLFYGIILLPNVFLILVPDHVAVFRIEPLDVDHTRVTVDWLFDKEEIASSTFAPDDAVALLDVTNRQDFEACERCQLGARSSRFAGRLTPAEHVITDFYRWLEDQLA